MPIASVDDYIAARKQSLVYYRTNQSRSISTLVWGSLLDLSGGNPSGGVLAGTDTTAGVVPTSSTAGFPFINSVGTQRAYLTMVDLAMSFAGRARWYDLLWKAGAYPFNANVTLSAQPSYASRLIIAVDQADGVGGREALTRYRVIERFARATLVECELATGRTHQIRVHMAHIGHPLVGDATYGKARSADPRLDAFSRQALHAWQLGLIHPRTGEPCRWETPLPADFEGLLALLRSTTP